MAKLATIGLVFVISCFLAFTSNVYARKQAPFAEEEGDETFFRGEKEKLVRLRVYVHDLKIGHVTPTVYEVAIASITDSSPTSFGSVHVLDDLITDGPLITSKAIGRLQGLTTNADLSVMGVAMNLNFFFSEGKFNGSTLSILGRNRVMDPQRELPVVGGTGVFRFARGYAIQTSYSSVPAEKYAVLEYNIYVACNPAKLNVPRDMDIAEM